MDNHLMLFAIANAADDIEQRQKVRINNKRLRDNSNPFELPESNFMKMFRLRREMAWNLCEQLSDHLHVNERITGVPIILKILTALFFFAHGSYQKCVGANSLFGLSQSSVSRCINCVAIAMCEHLLPVWIQFPMTDEAKQENKIRFYENFNFSGVIGCIDCTHVAIIAPNAEDINFPELAYINRKGYHSINTQIICNADLRITAINARYPGSVHDAAIWSTSSVFVHLRQKYQEDQRSSWLLGDSGYPLQPWLLTPIVGAAPESPEERYTRRHITTHNSTERCIGLLKARFRYLLKHRTLHYNPVTAGKIIYSCAILHNMALHNNIPEPEMVQNEEIVINNIPRNEDIWLQEGRQIREQLIRNVFN